LLEVTWEPSTSAWVNYYRDTYIYDASGNVLTFLEEIWDTSTSSWLNYLSYTCTIDASGNMIDRLIETWNSSTSVWENVSHRYYTYDDFGNSITGNYETWNINNWVSALGSISLYIKNIYQTSFEAVRYEASFISFETGIEEYALPENIISVFPNPTNGIFNLEFSQTNVQKITIWDITGKLILEKTNLNKTEQIDLSPFESGIYIIRAQTENELFTTKIVKE